MDQSLFKIGDFNVTNLHGTIGAGLVILIIIIVLICCYISYRKREAIVEKLPEPVRNSIKKVGSSIRRMSTAIGRRLSKASGTSKGNDQISRGDS